MTKSPSISSAASTVINPNNILTYDEIDDLIYLARTGDLESLKETITTNANTHSISPSQILLGAIDEDDEGLGSKSSLLHYPAANGNLEIIQYLLSLLQQQVSSTSDTATTTATAADENGNSASVVLSGESLSWLNHQNVSGNTALHWAGMNGHINVVKALVSAGADLEIVNAAGRDAVFEADCSALPGAAECAVEMLKVYEALERKKGNGGEEGENDETLVVEGSNGGQDGGAAAATAASGEKEEGDGRVHPG